jgi:hypothetical protein
MVIVDFRFFSFQPALSSCCPALYESGLKTENLKSRPNIEVEYRFGEGDRFPRS